MDWISALEKLAPTVASCLGTPVAGMAVAALETALGVTGQDSVQSTIESGKLDGAQVVAIQQAEMSLKAQAQGLGLNFEKLAVDDRTSARSMQVATKSWIVPGLAIFVTVGFFGLLAALILCTIPKESQAIIYTMVGSLGAAWLSIINFFYGSSNGSQNKDSTIKLLSTK
jgi:hypothetical protein